MPETTQADATVELASEKMLALGEGCGSSHAYCIGSAGAFTAINDLSPKSVRQIFTNTRPEELRELANMLDEHIKETFSESDEGQVKDLTYKREVLLRLADEHEDKEVVEKNDEGRYVNPRED